MNNPIYADTHAHLYDERFDSDRNESIRIAIRAGVNRIAIPAVDSESHQKMLDICAKHPGHLFPLMGVHPTSINDNPKWKDEVRLVEFYLNNPTYTFYGIGEIGIDLYWNCDFLREQEEAFRAQLDLAIKYNLPVIIHIREAFDETIRIMTDYNGKGLTGIFHSFAGNAEQYRILKNIGEFKFGIGGMVTFKKAAIAETVLEMDLSDLVLETDAPYLTPVPHRGKRNESGYIPYIAQKIADLKNISLECVAAITTANAEEIFGWQ